MSNSKYYIQYTNKFKKQYKKLLKNPNFKKTEFEKILGYLSNNELMPAKYRNHLLNPKSNGVWECHVQPDILLEYQKFEDNLIIILLTIDTHSNLF